LAGGLSPLSLLTFFAAAKKVSAAPHRGNANIPIRKQGKAKTKTKTKTKQNEKTTKNKPKMKKHKK
jgi:general secretion pathway protein K